MKSLKLLQIGDVHYPVNKNKLLGDFKDKGAPAAVIAAIGPNRFHNVMRMVAKVVDEERVDGLLICGDLTNRGDLDEYDECVKYLGNVLALGDTAKWKPDTVHVVPGNHDVNLGKVDPKGEDLYCKFQPLIESWNKLGLHILAVDGVRATMIEPNGHSLSVFSLNSCIGCQERRSLPEKIRNDIHGVMTKYAASAPPDDAFDLLYEELDTPAIDDGHIEQLIEGISGTPDTSLPVVLAHHNALPQSVPRVEIYTELINSGRFRTRMAACRRPVIYCHGHIHDDPIEQVVDRRYPEGSVIFVSAPEIIDGFNLLTIEFGRNMCPLGCEVTEYRAGNPYDTVELAATLRVPLVTPHDLPRFDDEELIALVQECNGEPARFRDLRSQLCKRLDRTLRNSTVRDLVVEAEWLSLVQVFDRNQSHKYWKIRRAEP